jgi:hypothetical protein
MLFLLPERSSMGSEKKQIVTTQEKTTRAQLKIARKIWGNLSRMSVSTLAELIRKYSLSISLGDIVYLDGRWYVTHSGLLRFARKSNCAGIHVRPVRALSNLSAGRWAFKATVYKSRTCRGFVGYGDADPSNVSVLVHGAEMRVAETRAVNRALRKAYGIGICSVDELGSFAAHPAVSAEHKKPPRAVGNHGNGNCSGRTVRDRLCHLIRQHQLDATLVKSYATDFCGVKALRDATREQVEKFVAHLAEQAEKDRSALVCQLNSYGNSKAGAA